MICKKIQKGVIVCFSRTNFVCPHCEKDFDDCDNKYLDRCNKNKSGWTKIKCSCKRTFGMTYDMYGSAVGFKLKEDL